MEKNTEYLEKLVHINRITKVVKGGRRFGFSALVVVGNQNGRIGIAHAKAKQVPDAIKKANELARRNLIQITLKEGRTIHHDIYGKDGAGKIKLRAAPKGTGIIAGGPVRAVCEVLGIKDIVAKSLGTANPHNVIRACMKALQKQNSPKNTTSQVKIKKLRVGRGIGSGKGKTSGRGVKGQKSRSGVAIKSFEGGQMPLYRRLPKRGFNPLKKAKIAILNLNQIQKLYDSNRISKDVELNLEVLKKAKILSKSYDKLKILGSGEIKEKINLKADLASKSSKEKLEKVGGTLNLKHKK